MAMKPGDNGIEKKVAQPLPRATKKSPNSKEVTDFHVNSDKDGSRTALHHTLGPRPNQASPGGHSHDGGDSVELLPEVVFTGSRASAGMMPQIIAALVRLGAKDTTTP